MTGIFYVYVYLDPRTLVPFYVGKGKGKRMYDHLKEARSNGKIVNQWKVRKIRKIWADGLEPKIIVVASGLSEEKAFKLEASLIDFFDGMLTNIGRFSCSGGDTLTHHPIKEQIAEKIRQTMKEKKIGVGENNPCYGLRGENHPVFGFAVSPERIEVAKRNLVHHSGDKNGMFGKHHRPDSISKMKESKRGKYKLAENPNARTYTFLSPTGERHVVTGQRKEFSLARGLNPAMMGRLARGEISSYKGWTVE